MRLLLVRHAMCDPVGRALTGRSPGVHLNPLGIAQARAVAARLKAECIGAVHASPLERTVETARMIADASSVPLGVDVRLTELDFGAWTGCDIASLADDEHWQRFNSHRSQAAPPAGELATDAQQRALDALTGIARVAQGFPVVAVTHGDIIRYVLSYVLGMSLDDFHRLEVAPASISTIELHERGGRVLGVNDMSHLRQVR